MFQFLYLIATLQFSLFNLFSTTSESEFNKGYDKLRYEVELYAHKGLESKVDSLIARASTKEQKAKSLLLMSMVKGFENESSQSLFYALESQKIALQTNNYELQIICSRFVSTKFIAIDMLEEASKHIKIADIALSKLPKSANVKEEKAFIIDEKAYFEMQSKNYNEVKRLLTENITLISSLESRLQRRLMNSTYQMLGLSLLELGEYIEAEHYFFKSIRYSMEDTADGKLNVYAGDGLVYAYYGLANVELHRKNYSLAYSYLTKANNYLKKFPNEEYNIFINRTFSKYFKALHQYKEALAHDELATHAEAVKRKDSMQVYNELLKIYAAKDLDQRKKNTYLAILAMIAVLSVIFLIFKIRMTKQREKKLIAELLNNVNNNLAFQQLREIVPEPEIVKEKSGISIPKETEERILVSLIELEKEDFYLQGDITLMALANLLNTNSKYLSYVINRNTSKDFNNYINELRIRYIIKKFQTDPEYLTFKLAYIAEKAGFSSHSKFTSYFKSITGVSPTNFISQLKKEKFT